MPNRIAHRPDPSPHDVRRWRRYLANERAEAETYRELAKKRKGEDREILLGLAESEKRHEQHWIDKLGPLAEKTVRPDFNTQVLGFFARHFGSVFALALMQNFEARTPYADDPDATDQMEADERIHEEVVRSLATRSRAKMSGTFRAAVFGANDGLVSNLALVLGVGATGVSSGVVLATGLAGLLAGALSMAAGEYVSVSSQRELLAASTPNADTSEKLPALDVNENELALVYRARGMSEEEAKAQAAVTILTARRGTQPIPVDHHGAQPADNEELGTPKGAAASSFLFFAVGALIPVLPWLFGFEGIVAVVAASVVVGLALLLTGGIVGVLSGATPWKRALRQLMIGYGAAAVTYVLGLAFGGIIM